MFLRCKVRRKDGKHHRYWSVVENSRVAGGRVVQRHVLYLGEINDTQELAWRRSIAVLEDGTAQPRTLSLFPEDRCERLLADASIVRVKLSELRLRRPRQWGACWLALLLWRELQLDQFWCQRLGVSRKGTRWDQVLFVLVAYRLLAPGSEWHCTVSGFSAALWPICWARMPGSPRSTSCIAAMHVDRLRDFPIHIVHGRYDRVCHLYQAEALVRALRGAGNSEVHYFITTAGHSSLEPETDSRLRAIMDDLPPADV
jgi:pimeloyl-ACP methyl ester carboxylesterase